MAFMPSELQIVSHNRVLSVDLPLEWFRYFHLLSRPRGLILYCVRITLVHVAFWALRCNGMKQNS